MATDIKLGLSATLFERYGFHNCVKIAHNFEEIVKNAECDKLADYGDYYAYYDKAEGKIQLFVYEEIDKYFEEDFGEKLKEALTSKKEVVENGYT